MAKFHCPEGHTVTVKPESFGNFRHEDLICPTHRRPLQTGMQARATKKSRQRGGGLRDTTDAEVAARQEFSRLVCEWPCFARKNRPCELCKGRGFAETTGEVCSICNGDGLHQCRGYKNAHHLLPVDELRRIFSDLPEDEFLAIAFAPIIGAPACQHNFHAALEAKTDYVYWEELDPELIEFVKRIDSKYGPDRPSLLLLLERESPPSPERVSA